MCLLVNSQFRRFSDTSDLIGSDKNPIILEVLQNNGILIWI